MIYAHYLWSNGDTLSTLPIFDGGTYSVQVTDSIGCLGNASTFITEINTNVGILGDSVICNGATTLLSTNNNFATYLWNNGDTISTVTITNGGIYSVQVIDSIGCSATATTNIMEINTNVAVTQANGTLTADAVNASYQWIECTLNIPLLYDTLQSFSPIINGNYAVIITQNNCADTSICFQILTTSVWSLNQFKFSVVPNPNNGLMKLSYHLTSTDQVHFEIFDLAGRKLFTQALNSAESSQFIDVSNIGAGIYFYQFTINNTIFKTDKLVIKH
jgi:hypothetical protein